MIRLLNQPFPREEDPRRRLRVVFASALLVFLFLWIFRPFSLDQAPVRSVTLFIAGYGLVTLVVAGVFVLGLPLVWPSWFRERSWTVGKNILFYTLLIGSIGLGNALYTVRVLEAELGPGVVFTFQLYTLSVGMAVASLFTLIRFARNSHFFKAEAQSLDAELKERAQLPVAGAFKLVAENGKDVLQISPDALLYVESADNYSSVFVREGRQVRRHLLRGSLRMIEAQTQGTELVRCHRSYLVNLRAVVRISGNSQGYRAHFEGLEESIPVSRKAGPELHRHFTAR